MDELIDILDAHGQPTGKTALKSQAHQQGLYHASIHLWLYTHKGEILLQLRQTDKDTFPNHWDVSVAGHISAGESAITTVQREALEEIGLSLNPDKLQWIGEFFSEHQHGALLDRELHHSYMALLEIPVSELKCQPEEVADIKLTTIPELENLLEVGSWQGHPIVPHTTSYYTTIIKAIKKSLG